MTVENVAKIFLKRVFSPRLVGQTMDKSISYRGKDILACHAILEAVKYDDVDRVRELKALYQKRLISIYETDLKEEDGMKPEADLIELYNKVASAVNDPKVHPISLYHVEKAFEEKVKDENLQEARESQRIYRGGEPEVGKTYGLSTDAKGENGLILAIEAEVFPASGKREERDNPAVLGTVQKSVKENAFLAKEFLRKYCPNINTFDIDVHMISPIEGSDVEEQKPSGFSAGLAITLSIASALGKIPLNPNICMTGRIELKSGWAGLVGGIHPKRGSGKIDVAADEGFKKIVIPEMGFELLKRDFNDYVDAIRGRGTEIIGGKNFLEYMELSSELSRKQIITKLKNAKIYPTVRRRISS